MSEVIEKTEETTVQTEVKNPFDAANWTTEPVVTDQVSTTVIEEKKVIETKENTVVEDEILDPKEWLKREFDVDDPAVIKQGMEELKRLRETATTKEEIKYANDQSRMFHEAIIAGKDEDVYSFLDKKRKLSSVDKLSASEVLKLHIGQTNEHYSKEDITDVYEEKYSLPPKPVKELAESEEEYAEVVAEWQTKVDKVTRRIERDAIAAKQDLAKMNIELVLPDIPKKEVTETKVEPTQEELESNKRYTENFLKSAESSVQKFEGFTASVKDKDVDFPVSYVPSIEEKAFVSKKLNDLAANGYNLNSLLADRWVNSDRSINTDQVTKDLLRLYNDEKISQAQVNDAAGKRMDVYFKEKKQINVNETTQNGQFRTENDGKSEMQKVQDFFWNN